MYRLKHIPLGCNEKKKHSLHHKEPKKQIETLCKTCCTNQRGTERMFYELKNQYRRI